MKDPIDRHVGRRVVVTKGHFKGYRGRITNASWAIDVELEALVAGVSNVTQSFRWEDLSYAVYLTWTHTRCSSCIDRLELTEPVAPITQGQLMPPPDSAFMRELTPEPGGKGMPTTTKDDIALTNRRSLVVLSGYSVQGPV